MSSARTRCATYDADGNYTSVVLQEFGTTRTYSWGYNNELQQITYGGGGTNTFTYDGTGRHVTKTDSTGSYSFVYDGNRIISDGQAVYTRAGDSRLISDRRGNNSKWHHSDGLTSSRTLTSNTQSITDTFRYDVWGDIAERTGTTPTPHQFVGALGYEQEADSGLYFIGTRYYDSSTGRFLSQDLAQWGVNWYVYAANNPANAFDREGLIWETLLDIAGLVVDVIDFVREPSWGGARAIALDVGGLILPVVPSPGGVKLGIRAGEELLQHGDGVVDVVKHIDDPPLYHYTDSAGVANTLNTGQITSRPPHVDVYATPTPPSGITDQGMLFAMTGKSRISSAFEIQNSNGWLPVPGKPGGQPQLIHPSPVNVTPVGQTYFDFMKNGDPIFVYPVIQR
jgi:RHS repeat-associated protein